MQSAEINRRFLAYFESRGHTVVPSASLISDDPTLLLVPAGMVPLKPYFLLEQTPPWPRATSIQKCVRTPDIDVVGTTTRHLTFFQMAGNFSFGDYFKDQAIPMAWELLTSSVEDGGFGFDPERLWATIFFDDDEAFSLWTDVVGLPPERVQRRGMEDNFWSMGVPGPCGPCSEIYFDRGPEYGKEGGPIADEDRYLEVWNLVFMQYVRGAGQSKDDFPILGELPAKNIDTGLGVERMAALLQGVDNVYETDLLRPILDLAGRLTGVTYNADHAQDVRLRVIADHTRTATMIVGDGVTPSNEGRGYVLRRMLRRVIRNARLLGADGPVMRELVQQALDVMTPSYPELADQAARILAVVVAEEESFAQTLRSGTLRFENAAAEATGSGSTLLDGARAFELHDTYGFPIDLTLEMAADAGLTVDEEGFRRLMAQQRQAAKQDAYDKKAGGTDVSAYRDLVDATGPSLFTGYEAVTGEATVRGLLAGGVGVPAAGAGDEIELVLDRTPFYAEAGGQIADAGFIRLASGAVVEVLDVQRPVPGLVVHRGVVRKGEVTVGDQALAEVDVPRRMSISRAHTATHLLHQALRKALGETATQAGSYNAPGRLRFDFASPTAVVPSVLHDIEDEVNAVLIEDLEVRAFVTTQEEARRIGAMALFGEKYGDQVRVVEVGDYARELCGGTHAGSSAQLGLVKLLGESSIGAGVRRVDALVGLDAFRYLAREHVLVSQVSESLKLHSAEELPERIAALTGRLRDAERELDRLRAAAVLRAAPDLARGAADIDGVAVVTHAAGSVSADDVRKLAVDVRGRLDAGRPGVAAVIGLAGDKPVLVVAVNEAARGRGLKAGELVRLGAGVLGGGGGGKDDLAQGGGTDPSAVEEALAALRQRIGQAAGG
ncbi:MAG: alanyl-tRNA synthetase [Frankiales bacterium]|jgi:alanyl-tRNA synthetase|nr:alanyl-tRNA synthetase [Frankiales bacterium]